MSMFQGAPDTALLPEGPMGWIGAAVACALCYFLCDNSNNTAAAGSTETAAADGNEPMCRVCYAGAEAGRLFSPCRCFGTMLYVHVHCLNEWRAASVNQRSFFTCDQCGYSYRTQRTLVAELLQSDRFVGLGSWVLLALVIFVASLAPGHPEQYFYSLT